MRDTVLQSNLLDEYSYAEFSKDDKYRYQLRRNFGHGKDVICWCMLNPSTANAFVLDPTLTRCKDFTIQFGGSFMVVVNLFALRSTDPKGLYKVKNPLGKYNKEVISEVFDLADMIILGWGTEDIAAKYTTKAKVNYIEEAIGNKTAYCLGTNQNGSPKHPLYLPKSTKLRTFAF